MDSMVQEDEGLWDELNYQQSREIEQHHARNLHAPFSLLYPGDLQQHHHFHAGTSAGRRVMATVSTTARRWAEQSYQEVGRVAAVFYHAAADAWQEQHERQALIAATTTTSTQSPYRYTRSRSSSSYLEEFGIPRDDQGDNDAMGPQQQQDDVYMSFAQEDSRPQHPSDFVLLPHLRFRPQAEGWGAVANLDLYFGTLYHYFYHRGLVPIIGKGVVELTTLIFTLVLSVFLFLYVDWSALRSCTDESTCRPTLNAYLIEKPWTRWNLWTFLVLCYCLNFILYIVFAGLSFLRTVQEAVEAKWVFEERLGISSHRLLGGAVDWDQDVVAKLLELQQSGAYRVAIHGQELDALVIAQRILRKENFLVAFFNRGLLDLTVPLISANQPMFSSTLEWSLYFCILNFMFNHKYQIRPAFYLDPAALRRRFILCGILHIVFMPFLLFFVTIYFGLQNAYDWKNTKQYLGPKDWSLAAKWTFREFNELQHHFERRIAPSYAAAENYLKLFGQSEVIAAVGRIFVFIGGALGAVLFSFAALNDAILLHVKIADWNLLWYAGVVGGLYSAGKAMMPSQESQPSSSRNLFAEIDEALVKVASHTHHFPQIWKGRGWEPSTNQAISSMFQYKARIFVWELLSLILAPYILCVSLARCAEPICEFVLAIRAEVAGAGDVCGYATFDFDKFGDETFEGRTMGTQEPLAGTLTESIMRTGDVREATKTFPKPKAKHGKMEKSFFSFRASHPSWKCSESGQNLVDREERRRKESDALLMERELHMDAAARQLEMLAEMERRPNRLDDSITALDIDTSYIRPAAPENTGGAAPSAPLT